MHTIKGTVSKIKVLKLSESLSYVLAWMEPIA